MISDEQKEDIKLYIMPYIQNMDYISELINNASNVDELTKNVSKLLNTDTDLSIKTDLKILYEKLTEQSK
ncbi:hypothetical protein [Methanococcus voltae]|uniref:Uncharacterized protein n=1 Tax=Methanococcus voltae (strain ATCC BAA-1334 / A3) TaxID=456320 RepID=D7DV00_METV3|nr:hypothetical protein [Methanococcus voltae]MCS3900764.1 hypothetical protein [Methanococcus voltae]